MSVGFGFSAGDFIAGLELVATVIDAVRESGDSSRRYRELLRELGSLETALLQVKRLELHESQNAEKNALHSAASQCQRTITDFWQTVQKYHPSLGRASGSSSPKDRWMKVKWALFKEEGVEKFKADLRGHTGSINLLLTSCRVARQAAVIEDAKREAEQKSLMGLIQNSANEWMNSLSQVSSNVTSLYQQGKELLQMTATVLQTNIQVFHAVLDLQAWIKQIPGQVQHQQPVLFLDALGSRQHFHLDFIQSADALRAVLRDNFKKAGVGIQKIDRGEFMLHDRFRHVDIDLNQAWERCFRPGQTVEMSMLFASSEPGSSCPTCGQISDKKADEEVECSNCGMIFSRIVDLERLGELEVNELPLRSPMRPPSSMMSTLKNRTSTGDGGNDDVAFFRRVRISVIKDLLDPTENQGMGQETIQFGDQRFNQGSQRPNSQAFQNMLANLTQEQGAAVSNEARMHGSATQTSPTPRDGNPFAIPLHPTPKTYRSQSYSVGLMDPGAEPPVMRVKEVEDDDEESASESMQGSLHQSVESKLRPLV